MNGVQSGSVLIAESVRQQDSWLIATGGNRSACSETPAASGLAQRVFGWRRRVATASPRECDPSRSGGIRRPWLDPSFYVIAACGYASGGWLWPGGYGSGPGSGRGFVEPVEHPGAEQALGADLAVGAGALGVGEAGQGGGCGQVLHQFLGLAAEELVGLGAADEHWAGDLLGDPVAEIVGQAGGQLRARRADAEGPHALAGGPAELRAGVHQLLQRGVELGVGLGGEPAFGVRAQAEAGGVGPADAVEPVDADQRPDPRVEGRRPGGQAAAHAEP